MTFSEEVKALNVKPNSMRKRKPEEGNKNEGLEPGFFRPPPGFPLPRGPRVWDTFWTVLGIPALDRQIRLEFPQINAAPDTLPAASSRHIFFTRNN